MYGGSGKVGRGGGGGRGAVGGNKRNIHSTFHRPSSSSSSGAAATSGWLSTGGAGNAPRNRVASASAAPAASSSSAATEESFNLFTGNPLNFAMIIRLAPDLVEEIKRVESQGSVARIKFDANANNPAGNVISVGDKDFRFTWSREPGDLCDIYEECQSGEDGNGLLVESGSAWRKLNVQRVLDESTKNHVKMRSEEAERKLKSRKAIVLDHGNPSMKNHVKAMVAAESTSSWRMKGAPFKKRKPEPPPGGPPKSVQRLTTTPPPKGRPPASSPSSPPEQSVAPGSPVGGNLMKGHTDIEDTVSVKAMNKTASSEKDAIGKLISSAGRGKQGQKALKGTEPADLHIMLISLLGECPSKGMSLKALEKAIGDAIPNSVRQIEPILKKIATFQAPGRYFLKPGVEIESCKKPLSQVQSSPEDNLPSPLHDGQQPAIDTTFAVNEIGHAELDHEYEEAHNLVERGNASHHSTDLFGEKKVAENSVGPVGSSSDSGSDSDSESDSSDSGSDSGTHSRSRSRSAGGSGSGSSSDSESDASTKSKEASDEDVDIMTSDDDKQVKHKLEVSAIVSFRSPPHWSTSDGEHARMGSDEKQDSHVTDLIEIERDFTGDQSVRGVGVPSDSVRNKERQKAVDEDQERQESTAKIFRQTGNISKDGFKRGQSDSSDKASRGKYKRVLEEKHEDKSDRSKKLKSGNSHQPLVSGSRTAPFQGSHQNLSPDRHFENLNREPNNMIANRSTKGINSSFGSGKSYEQTSSGKSLSDSQQPIQKLIDPSSHVKSSSSLERPCKHSDSMGHDAKHPNKLHQMTEGFQMERDKFNREMHDVYSSSGHKGPIKVSKEDFVQKHTTPADTRQKRHESFGNLKEFGLVSNSPKDENSNGRDRSVNGRPNVLQRELSDLEMGELREPEETSGFSKQFDMESSFKQSEIKALSSKNWNPDSSKSKPVSKMAIDSRKPSPPNASIPVSEGMSKRGIPEHVAGDNSKPHVRGMQIQHLRYQSRVDSVDIGVQPNRVVELSGRNRHGDTRAILDTTPEVHMNFPSKGLATIPQEHEAKQVAVPLRKESRRPKSNAIPDLNDKQKDSSLTGSSDGCQKRMESSSDENSCPYSKYEKDEPELKGPIKDLSQYKEYVDEFQEKHVSYCSINKILQAYGCYMLREEFLKYKRDLEACKGKDMERYKNVARQIKESYGHCGEKFQRLRKIFAVLHEELQHLKQMIKEFSSQYS